MPEDMPEVEEDDRYDVVEPVTGLPRVMSSKCPTCIFRPGNLMQLQEGRVEGMVAQSLDNWAWIACHQTMNADQAGICRGFYDVHGRASVGIRLAHQFARRRGLDWPACTALDPPPKQE